MSCTSFRSAETRRPVVRGLSFALLVVAMAGGPAACGGDGQRTARPESSQRASRTASRSAPSSPAARPVALGQMATVAGGGEELGDGGPATTAGFCGTVDVARDAAGNLYIADGGLYCEGPGGNSVRKVDTEGVVTTVAGGTGVVGFAGDGGPATKATLDVPVAVAVDRQGNLYIADADNFRIRKVDPAGTITTIAGTGEQGVSGDGGPARSARLMGPQGMVLDARGNLYVADFAAVRKIDRSGVITRVAGTGTWVRKPDPEHLPSGPRKRFSGEGGRATSAMLIADDVALDGDGSLYVADSAGGRIYKVGDDERIRTVAGSVAARSTRLGDGGPATAAFLDGPSGIEVDRRGNLIIADHHGERIRQVDPMGTITTIAGTGVKGFSGERGRARELKLNDPSGLALGEPGIVYVADLFNGRIRAVRYEAS
jgi:sugar lactone lactonase YvrE